MLKEKLQQGMWYLQNAVENSITLPVYSFRAVLKSRACTLITNLGLQELQILRSNAHKLAGGFQKMMFFA
jgi:hypothetical protein